MTTGFIYKGVVGLEPTGRGVIWTTVHPPYIPIKLRLGAFCDLCGMDDVPLLCALLLDVLSTDAQGLSLGHPHVARVVEATSVAAAATMRPKKKKNTKKKKKKKPPTWGDQYKDPGRPGV